MGFNAWRDCEASFDRVDQSIAGGKYIVKIITNDLATGFHANLTGFKTIEVSHVPWDSQIAVYFLRDQAGNDQLEVGP